MIDLRSERSQLPVFSRWVLLSLLVLFALGGCENETHNGSTQDQSDGLTDVVAVDAEPGAGDLQFGTADLQLGDTDANSGAQDLSTDSTPPCECVVGEKKCHDKWGGMECFSDGKGCGRWAAFACTDGLVCGGGTCN